MSAADHVRRLRHALTRLEPEAEQIEALGERIGTALAAGARLLAVGNGGSAAQAEHLTAELVGRYDGERRPLAAVAIGAEHATATAIANDYGHDDAFARPVHAHGRPGDVLIALSTSGRSANVLSAVTAADDVGLLTVGLTGRRPNPLADACSCAIGVDAASTATVQEVHQVVIHLLCRGIDRAVRTLDLTLSSEATR